MFMRQHNRFANSLRVRGATGTGILALLVVVAIVGIAIWINVCPCDRIPGSYLTGDTVDTPVSDWSFVNSDVELCQIEVKRGLLPHSINLNCMADDGELFLSCANCDGKAWSTAALNNPEARLRANGQVYPVRLTRVEDASTLDRAWQAREGKLGRPTDRPRQEGWWSFAVRSRT